MAHLKSHEDVEARVIELDVPATDQSCSREEGWAHPVLDDVVSIEKKAPRSTSMGIWRRRKLQGKGLMDFLYYYNICTLPKPISIRV